MRITLEFSPAAMRSMEDLSRMTETEDYATIIRNALSVYHGLGTQIESGVKIILRSAGIEEEFAISDFKERP